MRALERLGLCVVVGLALCFGCGDDTLGPPLDAGADAHVPDDDMRDGGRDASTDEPDGEAPEIDAGADAAENAPDAADDAGDASDVDGATDDDVAPELISSSPIDGDDDIAFDRVHWLQFSEPVVLGEGAITLHVVGDARALAITATLRDGDQRVELTFDELPELPAELELELSAAITDAAGNAFEPRQLSFGVPIWQRIGSSLSRSLTDAATDVALAIDL